MTVKDYQIPGTNLTIEKGVEVHIPAFALHRDGKYFNNPEKFDPERFSDENTADRNLLNGVYLPFGDGPVSNEWYTV